MDPLKIYFLFKMGFSIALLVSGRAAMERLRPRLSRSSLRRIRRCNWPRWRKNTWRPRFGGGKLFRVHVTRFLETKKRQRVYTWKYIWTINIMNIINFRSCKLMIFMVLMVQMYFLLKFSSIYFGDIRSFPGSLIHRENTIVFFFGRKQLHCGESRWLATPLPKCGEK